MGGDHSRGTVLRNGRQLATHGLILELGEFAWRLESVAAAVDPVLTHLDRLGGGRRSKR
jgi:hypothetical protein